MTLLKMTCIANMKLLFFSIKIENYTYLILFKNYNTNRNVITDINICT